MLLLLLLCCCVSWASGHIAAPACDLTGRWAAVSDDNGYYQITQTPAEDDETLKGVYVGTSNHWKTFVGTLSGIRVALKLDSGNHIEGNINTKCDSIPWDNKSAHKSVWCRNGTDACKKPPSPPAPPPRDVSFVKRVHVTSMNHLDVGFINPGSGEPPATALDVLNRYINDYLPKALETAAALHANGEGYTYTTHSWLVSYLMDCPNKGNGPAVICPNATAKAAFTAAVKDGRINYHAFPFNPEYEAMYAYEVDAEHMSPSISFPYFYSTTPDLFESGLHLTHELDTLFGLPNRTVLSLRDVPGLTRAAIPFLAKYGVKAVSVGVNTYSGPPAVARIFKWHDTASNTGVYGLWHPGGYGGVNVNDCVIIPQFDEALCPHFVGDNGGPPSAATFASALASVRTSFPNAIVHNSTFDAYIAALDAATPGAKAARASLPVVTKEIGDTWIYGLQADPIKATLLRELSRTLHGCGQSTKCNASSAVAKHFARALIKLTEHTFGYSWGYLNDHERWNNTQLEAALLLQNRTGDAFRGIAAGWTEQRSWADHAVAIAGASASASASGDGWSGKWLEADANRRIAAIAERGLKPNLTGFLPLTAGKAMAGLVCNGFGTVQFNRTGAFTLSRSKRNNADGNAGDATTIIKGAGQYQYNTLNETDIHRFMEEYLLVQRDVAFGKLNVDTVAHPVSGHWLPTMVAAYAKVTSKSDGNGDSNGNSNIGPSAASDDDSNADSDVDVAVDGGDCEVWIELAMPTFLSEKYGAPKTLWSHFNLVRSANSSTSAPSSASSPSRSKLDTRQSDELQGELQGVRLEVEVRWLNKTATRLPEAHFVGFDTVPSVTSTSTSSSSGAPSSSSSSSSSASSASSSSSSPSFGDTWLVDKLGQYVDVSPSAMVEGCSAHLHAVGENGVTNCIGPRARVQTKRTSQASCTTILSVDSGLYVCPVYPICSASLHYNPPPILFGSVHVLGCTCVLCSHVWFSLWTMESSTRMPTTGAPTTFSSHPLGGAARFMLTCACHDVNRDARVSVGQPNPYPTPLVEASDAADRDGTSTDTSTGGTGTGTGTGTGGTGNGGQGVFFVLHNNLWDTNYPVWFPFGADKRGASMGFRFVVMVT